MILKNIIPISISRNYFSLDQLWVTPIIKYFFSDNMINKIINKFDRLINVKKSAFKFTLVLRKTYQTNRINLYYF